MNTLLKLKIFLLSGDEMDLELHRVLTSPYSGQLIIPIPKDRQGLDHRSTSAAGPLRPFGALNR